MGSVTVETFADNRLGAEFRRILEKHPGAAFSVGTEEVDLFSAEIIFLQKSADRGRIGSEPDGGTDKDGVKFFQVIFQRFDGTGFFLFEFASSLLQNLGILS